MTWLTNQFLVAMPSLMDSVFERTVVLICQHNEDGALGIVVNRTTELLLEDILQELNLQVEEDVPQMKIPVHFGGPVQVQRGLVLHEAGNTWAATLPIGTELGLTMSKDVLEAISEKRGPRQCMPLLGFAGWESGQLESEMKENVWLTAPADNSIIFGTPIEERWQRAGSLVGVDIATMSPITGNA